MNKRVLSLVCVASLVGAGMVAVACSDDSDVNPPGSTDAGPDVTVPDGGPGGDGGDAAAAAAVARGSYLVNSVAGCPDCHTPRGPGGILDQSRWLAGVECLVGNPLDGGTPDGGDAGPQGPGCLNSRNLTNDATGLKNRTDQEIKDMFMNGVRPNGETLVPVMPYSVYHNLSAADADAIVAYLRTIPGVAHDVPKNDPPWNVIPQSQPLADSKIPSPAAGSPNFDSATRGRYLAVIACIDCHSPPAPQGSPDALDTTKLFAGSNTFAASLLHFPSPPFPPVVYSQNLTQDPTGLQGYTADIIVRELKKGLDKDGGGICPPMPAGPTGAFGTLTDADALDIANYILTLPGISSQRPENCVAP